MKANLTIFAMFTTIALSSLFALSPEKAENEVAALREAAMWLDASDGTSLVLGTGGQVVEWRSQTGGVSAKPGKRRSPVFRLDAEKRPSVDFGKMGSDMDLSFPRIVGIRTVFAVGRFDSAMGCHVLCDGKQYDFHRGRNGEYASDEWSNVARVWNGTQQIYDGFLNVVKQVTAFHHGVLDGDEVVIHQDHLSRILCHFGTADTHGHTDICCL